MNTYMPLKLILNTFNFVYLVFQIFAHILLNSVYCMGNS